ncbi:MAG TPA: hypothetical protein VM165_13475, partial [Planctomycetaceae bacterium]|nr:hypothetical protein [Planctomycetaceae bacterium]
MPETPRDSFERTFPRHEWFSGVGRTALVWSVLNGVLLCLLLLIAGLVVGLLIDRGRLNVTLAGPDIAEFERVTGHVDTTPTSPPETLSPAPENDVPQNAGEEPAAATADIPSAQPARQPAATNEASRYFEDAGLLPAVWRARHSWWGGMIAAAYRQFPALRQNVSALLVLLLLGMTTWIAMVWTQAQLRAMCRNAALEVSARMWRQLHRQAMRLETEDLDGSGVAGTQTLFTTEIARLRTNLYEWLYRGARYRWELVFLIVAACSVEWLLAVQWTLLSILGCYVVARSQTRVAKTLEVARDQAARELDNLADALRSARLVRGFGMDIQETESFQDRLARYVAEVRIQNHVEDNPLWLRLLAAVAAAALATLTLFLLGAKVLMQDVSPAGGGVFLAAFLYGMRCMREVWRLPEWRTQVTHAASKIWRYLDVLPTVSQAVGAKFLQPLAKTLHWESVTYRQPGGRLLLDRLDLQLRAGRTYSVASLDTLESRAFLFLLLRFIEPQSGRVLFDGEDIAWATLESLRAEVLLVSADDPLLPGT